MKKVLGLLLCLLLLCVLPVVAFANEETDSEGQPAPITDCSHSGGEAKCNARAVCDTCKQPYGEFAKHSGGTAKCNARAVCDTCKQPYGEFAKHSGGTAKCNARAVCGTCKQPYGEFANHSGGTAKCNARAVCDTCKEPYGEFAKHSGGTAKCNARAVCDTCKEPYGEFADHSGGAAKCNARAVCDTCKQPYGKFLDHTFNANGTCEGCNAPIVVSLSANSFTYNGSAHTPSVSVTGAGITFASEVKYENNINAGTAKVTVTVPSINYSTSKNFTIEKANLTIGPNDITITQNDGQPKASLYFSGLVAGQTVTVSPAPKFEFYTTSGDQTWLDDPVNFMGKYTIKWVNASEDAITVSGGNGNYNIKIVTTGTLNVIPTKAYFDMAGVKTYATVDGYAVNMHAMSEKNLDKILSNPNKEGTIELKFTPKTYLNYINTVRIPTNLVEEIAKAANDAKSKVKSLEVTLMNGRSIKLDAEALDSIAEEAEGKFVAITMVKSNDVKTAVDAEPLSKAQKKDLGERPAYLVSIASGKEVLEDVEGSFVMQIPYKTLYNETEEGLKVSLIDEEGKRTAVKTSYDEDTDKVVWEADSLGLYVIEHEKAK